MRKLLLSATSLLAIAAPAWGQGTPESVRPQAGDQVQARPTPGADATATAADPSGADAGEEIVVTGYRQSLRSAAGIKRNAIQIVDAIVAEDIGKLPDRTVSEALARVPGVTVERQVGEAGDVFVRGLRDPATTYNGRDIFTAEARTVAPQDFPAGGVAGLEVYKSLTADQVEGNLAGLINVRSRRPFDFQGFEVAGGLNGTYADRSGKYDWNGNLLVSNRWTVGDGEIGVLLNASNTQLRYQDSARFVSGDFFGINPDPARPGVFVDNFGNNNATTVRVPVGVGLFQSPGKRIRPSGNASIQWRPTPELEFYVDGLYQGFRRQVSDRLLFVPIFGGGSTYTNVALRSGISGRYADSISAVNQATPDGFQAATREKTDTYQVAAGGAYDNDRIRAAFDVARTKSKFDLSVYSVDYRLTRSAPLNVVFDAPGGDGGAEFSLNGLDLTNLGNYLYRGFFDRQLVARGDDYQYRVDFTFKEVAPFIPSIQVGARYVNRDGSFSDGSRYSTRGENVPYGSLPLQFELTRDGYRGDINPSVRQLNLPTYASIRAAGEQLRTIAGFASGLPPADPRVSYAANEKSFTGYGQINYGFDAGELRIDGAVGLRAIITDFGLNGTVVSIGTGPGGADQLVPLTIGNSYTDYLPNASIRLRFSDRLQLRAAYTETRTRPSFGQLNPGLLIDPPSGNPIRSARGGNPNLLPITSKNYDVSLETYFGQTGLASVALFRRDVSNFIVDAQAQVNIPNFGLVNIRGPINAEDGRIQGVEAQFRTFFDFDFVPEFGRGFGVELNYTYIDNELSAGAFEIEFPDVSKHSYNAALFYEGGGLSARVAYNYRSRYSQFFVQGANGAFGGEFVNNVSRLDASVSYQLTENLTLAADVSNILGKPFRNFREIEQGIVYPRDVRYEERVYSAGVRFRF